MGYAVGATSEDRCLVDETPRFAAGLSEWMPARRMRIGLAALVALVLFAPQADGDSAPVRQTLTFGVVPQRPFDDAEAELMTNAGIGSVRVWFSWAQVERRRGDYDWGLVDATVSANAGGGLATLPFLFGTPTWAAMDDGQSCEGEDCVSFAPRSNETRSAFAEFAAAAVRRYGPGGSFWNQHRGLPYRPIETWQVWNEPNLSSFYRPAVDPFAYASLVEAAAAGIRSEDPDALILLAGLTGTRTNAKRVSSTTFLTQLYSVADIAASFDGIAVHPYNRRARGVIAQIKAAARDRERSRRRRGHLGHRGRMGVRRQATLGSGQEPVGPGAAAEAHLHATARCRRAVGRPRRVLVRVAGHGAGAVGLRLVSVVGAARPRGSEEARLLGATRRREGLISERVASLAAEPEGAESNAGIPH